MSSCDYCGQTFDNEEPYIEHLAERYYAELGRIDKRWVDSTLDTDKRRSLKTLALGGTAVLIPTTGGAYLLQSDGSSTDTATGGQQPSAVGSIHIHGTLTMTVDGKRVDFSQSQYQLQADAFHFEAHHSADTIKKGMSRKDAQRYRCHTCNSIFNDLTGTIFAEHRLTLPELFHIIREIEENRTVQITRQLERSYRSVLDFVHEVQDALDEDPESDLTGVCEVDEIYVTEPVRKTILKRLSPP